MLVEAQSELDANFDEADFAKLVSLESFTIEQKQRKIREILSEMIENSKA